MNLYFIAYDNDDGEKLDLFVQAPSAFEGFHLVRAYWVSEWGHDEDSHQGFIIPGTPPGGRTDDVARVFEIKPNRHTAGVLEWADWDSPAGECNLIGYVDV